MRQALAGMLWTKQYFYYDLDTVARGARCRARPPQHERKRVRNSEWSHMFNDDIISMPDKWEYPWYAAWDLAFHMIPLGMVDPDFAKQQLDLMLRNDYLHPNGQMPAYEWNFGDVNPPVHAWATMQLYLFDKERQAAAATSSSSSTPSPSCWSTSPGGSTARIAPAPTSSKAAFSGSTTSASSTARRRCPPAATSTRPTARRGWCSSASRCCGSPSSWHCTTRCTRSSSRSSSSTRCYIAGAMDRVGDRHDEMWDEEDGFFYDVLRFPDGSATRLKVRSMVGLLPLAAVAVFEEDILAKLPKFRERARLFIGRHPELAANMHLPQQPGVADRRMLSIVDETKLRRILARMLDENEFFGPHGIRALSRYHLDHPYVFHHGGTGASRRLCAGRFRHGNVRRQLQLARAGLDAGQLPAVHARCCASTPTTATTSRSNARPVPGSS